MKLERPVRAGGQASKTMAQGLIFDIKRFAIHDGPGIRLTCFTTGCPLSCWWCHNPEALRRPPTDESTCGHDSNGEPGERRISVAELMAEIAKEQVFIDESGGGVTFSGGEPLVQLDFLDAALTACREREIHTAVDTSGYAPRSAFARVADRVDLFLYDLKLIDDQAHRKYTGVSNALIHENLRFLVERGRSVVIRIPVVPGFTGADSNIAGIADLLVAIGGIDTIHLLPYHKAASGKYNRLRLANRMDGVEPPSAERMETLRSYLEGRGFSAQIGG
jgi:pyruvate formate lyase activating enzyme